MPTLKISFTDKQYENLKQIADEQGISIQDYIRMNVCSQTIPAIFTPQEAVKRALNQIAPQSTFSLPDLYFPPEWKQISEINMAGTFGKRFYKYIEENNDKIEFVEMSKKTNLAVYKVK